MLSSLPWSIKWKEEKHTSTVAERERERARASEIRSWLAPSCARLHAAAYVVVVFSQFRDTKASANSADLRAREEPGRISPLTDCGLVWDCNGIRTCDYVAFQRACRERSKGCLRLSYMSFFFLEGLHGFGHSVHLASRSPEIRSPTSQPARLSTSPHCF